MQGFIYFLLATIAILILTSIPYTKKLIFNFLPQFLTAFGTIGIGVVSIMSSSNKIFISKTTWSDSWVTLYILFSILLLIAIIIGAKRNKFNRSINDEIEKNEQLKQDIKSYKKEYYKLCSDNIFSLFETFYTSGNERISIYKHHGDHFTLLGRYGKNPNHNRPTDYQYSDNEGIIGTGWSNGTAIITGAPKWVGKGSAYKDFMKERCQITDKRLKDVRMKSQSLYAQTLHDNGTSDDPDGIIVFESLVANKVTQEECSRLIQEKERQLLSLLKNMKSLTRQIPPLLEFFSNKPHKDYNPPNP
ncbi:MAG: hypothetical protein ACJARP_003014 [Vicingaceae bacterium]|jgi:hypothetical protein